MRKASLILVLLLLSLGIQAQNYNVRNYGAKGDGKTLYLYDTEFFVRRSGRAEHTLCFAAVFGLEKI